MIETIAFDADDTLWHNETLYQDAQAEFQEILSQWSPEEEIHRVLTETELGNLSLYGYGIKAFTLSMVETALKVSRNQIGAEDIEKILALGRSMLQAEVEVLPNIREVLSALSPNHRLMIITKGDLLDQTSKIARSGLENYFSLVEVLNHKTPEAYREILDKHNLEINTFMMVGNSLRSDIAPVLALRGIAVHIPASTTWEHELMVDFDPDQDGFYEINNIEQLPSLVEELDKEEI